MAGDGGLDGFAGCLVLAVSRASCAWVAFRLDAYFRATTAPTWGAWMANWRTQAIVHHKLVQKLVMLQVFSAFRKPGLRRRDGKEPQEAVHKKLYRTLIPPLPLEALRLIRPLKSGAEKSRGPAVD